MPDYELPSITPAELAAALDSITPPRIVDIRKVPARGPETLADAQLIDPFAFDHEAAEGFRGQDVVFFCVHGHEVSQFASALARVHGAEARYVVGGFEALVAAGAPLEGIA